MSCFVPFLCTHFPASFCIGLFESLPQVAAICLDSSLDNVACMDSYTDFGTSIGKRSQGNLHGSTYSDVILGIVFGLLMVFFGTLGLILGTSPS